MKVLKIIVVALAAVLAGVAAWGMTLPSSWEVRRTIQVDARTEAVYAIVSTAAGWEEMTAWAREQDPTWKMTVLTPNNEGEGMKARFEGEKLGVSDFTVTAAEPPQRITYTLEFTQQGFTLDGKLLIEPDEDESQVTMIERGDIGNNPFYRVAARMTRGMVEKDFDRNLARLRDAAEAREAQLEADEAMKAAEEEATRPLLDVPRFGVRPRRPGQLR